MLGYVDNTRTVSIMVGMMTLVYNVDEDDDEMRMINLASPRNPLKRTCEPDTSQVVSLRNKVIFTDHPANHLLLYLTMMKFLKVTMRITVMMTTMTNMFEEDELLLTVAMMAT